MAILKCKMCGGELNIQDGMTVAECEYCGTTQTLPKLVSDDIANLYDRANHFRRNNEFDKAEGIYERILSQTPEDAEAYWSLVLCRYGIEYVEDPATRKRVPTVNRTQYTSIFDDENYKSAIEHADAVQRRVYEEEAAAINEIQKGILAISQKEEPFDVFICYKESDNNGRRTPDSVLATDLYHQLTNEGFKVFFSRITLEDKLGTAYEPYIFAALNSAKVMVVLGTKPEYFNAVWVKNEWSRYLALVKASGGKKVLIPAYRDMDPYDLPEEFSHLQAQDMSKLGFMQDLIRGIKKITGADKPKTQPQAAVNTSNAGSSDIAPLLKRMFMYLEDGEWDKANEYSERVLDKDPENAEAYLGKLMAELNVHHRENLQNLKHPFDDRGSFKKAVRFGDRKLKAELNECIICIVERNKNEKYSEACVLQESGEENELEQAVELFKSLTDYKDSADRAEQCSKAYQEKKSEREGQEAQEAQERNERAARLKADKERLAAIRAVSSGVIAAGGLHTIGLRDTGTVLSVGNKSRFIQGINSVFDWRGIVGVSAGLHSTVGLKADGTVVAVFYRGGVDRGQSAWLNEISRWRDIVSISANEFLTVGLKADGTVVATGCNDSGQCNVFGWTDIIALSAGYHHTVGLKTDGTVVAIGSNRRGECNVSGWTDIIAVSAGLWYTFGLKSNGTVVATGRTNSGQSCDVSDWCDIVAIAAGGETLVGLKSDGTVVATDFQTDSSGKSYNFYNQCDVSSWKDIVAIATSSYTTVGLKSNGTVVAVGDNKDGQCNVSEWKLFRTETEKESEYKAACRLQNTGTWDNINNALNLFNGLGNYKDSPTRAKWCYGSLLTGEKSALQKELANLKGLFTGRRRKEIEARLAQIESELNKL